MIRTCWKRDFAERFGSSDCLDFGRSWRFLMVEIDRFRTTPSADKKILSKSTFDGGICFSTNPLPNHPAACRYVLYCAVKSWAISCASPGFLTGKVCEFYWILSSFFSEVFLDKSVFERTGGTLNGHFVYQGFSLQTILVKYSYIERVNKVSWSTGSI